MPQISSLDQELIAMIDSIINACETCFSQELSDILKKMKCNYFSTIARDKSQKEKAIYRQFTLDEGYRKNAYNIRKDSLNQLLVANDRDVWQGNWSCQELEESILRSSSISRNDQLSLPNDYIEIDMFLSLLKSFVGRINYKEMKRNLEAKMAIALKDIVEESFSYEIEDGQVIKKKQ